MDFAIFYLINFIFMEGMFHFYFWKDLHIMILPTLFIAAVIALLQALVLDCIKGKAKTVFFWIILGIDYLVYAGQMVYQSIFKQPLLLDAIFESGGEALTVFWRETLMGILHAGFGLIAMGLAIVWIVVIRCVLARRTNSEEPTIPQKNKTLKRMIIRLSVLAFSVACLLGTFFGMYKVSPESYEDYQSFAYPEEIIEQYGAMAFAMRDWGVIILPEIKEEVEVVAMPKPTAEAIQKPQPTPEAVDVVEPTMVPFKEQILNANYDYLKEIGSDEVDAVTDLVFAMEPTKENEYTGLFEGYNLIYITAEGFSSAAVDPVLTPTLYQLTHSGIVIPEYYVQLWQTSTSDGEYVNLTGLIPDQQFSMKRTANNAQPYSLANYFKAEGAECFAYHNNTLSYYDRHLSHPNLGYQFKASKIGDLDEATWGGHLFPMEHPNYWPSSDVEMIKSTVSEYVHKDRFHVYYMTVSGHMNYDFRGNKMSGLHYDEVQNLPYDEEGKAYVACNIELDRAISCLMSELYAAGKLDNTVICLSADHYPYSMKVSTYETLTGMANLENSLDIYRNSLILWNAKMETVTVDEPCSAMDLMPTLLNLFGFEYDSRLFSGRDIFSDKTPLVVFSNRSFITDKTAYNKKTGEVTARTEEAVSDEYIEAMKKYVRMLHKHSAGILNNDYYKYFSESVNK